MSKSLFGEVRSPSLITQTAASARVLLFLSAAGLLTAASDEPRLLKGWGSDAFGQIDTPPLPHRFVQIAAGGRHTVALRDTGEVLAWGDHSSGQTTIPPGLTGVVGIGAGEMHSLAVKRNGYVVAWGKYVTGALDAAASVPEGLQAVAVDGGADHSLAITRQRTVQAWGRNDYGQVSVPEGLENVTAVACGSRHSLALRGDGTVVAWGDNRFGQARVPPGLRDVTAIDAGSEHSIALKSDGTVVVWGGNPAFGLTRVPIGVNNVKAISAGAFHNVTLLGAGLVRAWGANSSGQCRVPEDLVNAMSIAAGGQHTIAVGDHLISFSAGQVSGRFSSVNGCRCGNVGRVEQGMLGWQCSTPPVCRYDTEGDGTLWLLWSTRVPQSGDYVLSPLVDAPLRLKAYLTAKGSVRGNAHATLNVEYWVLSPNCSNSDLLNLPTSTGSSGPWTHTVSLDTLMSLPKKKLIGCRAGEDLTIQIQIDGHATTKRGGKVRIQVGQAAFAVNTIREAALVLRPQ